MKKVRTPCVHRHYAHIIGPVTVNGSATGNFYANQSGIIGNIVFPGSFLTSTNTLTNSPVVITADLNRDGAQDVIALQLGVTVYENMTSVTPTITDIDVYGDPPIYVVRAIGRPAELLTLQGTSNFLFWSDVQTLRVGSGGILLFDGDATNTMRFFRLRPPR